MRFFLWPLAVIGLVVGTSGVAGFIYFSPQMLMTADRVHFPKMLLIIVLTLRLIFYAAVLGGSIWLTHWLVASAKP